MEMHPVLYPNRENDIRLYVDNQNKLLLSNSIFCDKIKYSSLSSLLNELYEEIVDNDKRVECRQNSRPYGNCVLLFQFTESLFGEWNPHGCIPINLDGGMAILLKRRQKKLCV